MRHWKSDGRLQLNDLRREFSQPSYLQVKTVSEFIHKYFTRGIGKNVALVFILCFLGAFIIFSVEPAQYSDSVAGHLEKDVDEITRWDTFWHCQWWAVATFTTVCYGDVSPTTHVGKLWGLIFVVTSYILIAYNLLDMASRLRRDNVLSSKNLHQESGGRNNGWLSSPDEVRWQTPRKISEFLRRNYIFRYFAYAIICTAISICLLYTLEFAQYTDSVAGHTGKEVDEIAQWETLWHVTWWSILTFATAGYGDVSPTTHMGKLVGMFQMLSGYFVTLSILAAGVEKIRSEMLSHFQNELIDAQQMQNSLLPKEPLIIEGLQIAGKNIEAREVGGDFFDYLEGDNKISVVVGDVSGKGLKGAMNAVMTSGILRLIDDENPGLEGSILMAKVNKALCRAMERDMNVTAVISQFDLETKQMILTNAGQHAYPLLKRSKSVEPIKAKGLALGIIPSISYKSVSLDLQSGDLLLFMTDGITEPRNAEGVMYEESGRFHQLLSELSDELSAEEVVEYVIQDVIEYMIDEEERDDDITIVAVKVT